MCQGKGRTMIKKMLKSKNPKGNLDKNKLKQLLPFFLSPKQRIPVDALLGGFLSFRSPAQDESF